MTEVTVQYRPLRLLPWSKTIIASHPNSWDELSPRQLIAGISALNGKVSDERIITLMTGLPRRIVHKLSDFQKLRIIEMISFLNQLDPYHEFIIPKVGPFTRPKPRLKDEYFGTFIFAESFFKAYETSFKLEDLDKFIVCWYRNRPFSENLIEINAHSIRKVDELSKQAVYINYILIRQYLALQYPNVFRPATDPESSSRSDWVDVFDAVVGEDIVNQSNYAKLPLSTVLRFLDKQIEKNRKS